MLTTKSRNSHLSFWIKFLINFIFFKQKSIYAVKPTNGFDQLANNIQTNNNTNVS